METPVLNEHNKQEEPRMHTEETNTPLKNKVLQKCAPFLFLFVATLGLSSCLNNLWVKVEPITLGNSSGGKTTVYFRDTDHDELSLSTIGKNSDVWDTTFNIAILYKPIYFKISGDTLHIMGNKPDYFRPELTDANIIYHWREGNPLCYEKQARADGYKIIHSLWNIEEYNQ